MQGIDVCVPVFVYLTSSSAGPATGGRKNKIEVDHHLQKMINLQERRGEVLNETLKRSD